MPRDLITQGETIQDLQNLAATLAANAAELPQLEPSRLKLEGVVGRLGALITRQADLAAQRQETSKELRELLGDGRRLRNLLRAGLKEHYGPRSEKLAAYKMQPFRGRKAPKPAEPEALSAPAPSAPDAQTP